MCDDNCEQAQSNHGEENVQDNQQHSSSKVPSRSGFRNIVRRIQLASEFSRLSKVNEDSDVFVEDIKLRTYSNATPKSARKRSKSSFLQSSNTRLGGSSTRLSTTSTNVSNTLLGDSANKNRFIKGEIKFLKEECKLELKPFITIDSNIFQTDVNYIFKDLWELEVPKIITFVISSKSHKCQWQNKKQINHFQIGIAKAAMSTNMWILTNGLNCGPTSYICSAIENELKKNRLTRFSKMDNIPLLIGISFANDLTCGNMLSDFNYTQSIVCIENQGYTNGEKFELNPYHSHFIIANNVENHQEQHNFTLNLIQMLVKGGEFSQICNKDSKLKVEIPLVSILIEGEPENINMVLNLVKRQIPVVVLQGSGGLADIVASAYYRIWDVFPDVSSWDADYVEDYVKPLLANKIGAHFSHLKSNHLIRNILRDQVIECIRHSKQDGREYVIILDMHKPNSCNLRNLSEHLLNALLRSRRNLHCSTHEQILRDLDLITDWNCAEVAKNLLFTQNSLNITEQFRSKFFNVLIRPNREQFVDIFLSHGFVLHKFVTPSRLSRLFRIIHDDEFFHTVCWESALGQSSNSKQSKFFIEIELNWLIEFCTGLDNFVNTEDLHLNSVGLYTNDSLSAERKALALLAIWAVMQNRYELVKVFWKYSDHPVHLALLISMFFERLSYNVMDINTKAEMKQKSKQFGEYAKGVLDRCYNENISQAYNVLRESIKDWNYMTAVDLAASAHLRQFIAHPCCQKWLTNTFQGKIRLREITWGFFTIPIPVKILLCSMFVFPMYIWVRFKDENLPDSSLNKTDLEEEFDVYENMYSNTQQQYDKQEANLNLTSNMQTNFTTSDPSVSLSSPSVGTNSTFGITNKGFEDSEVPAARSVQPTNRRREVFVKRQPPLCKMIQMMWCSPITKFYTSQLFYMVFLVFISLATLYPNCGSTLLDSIVCLWTILIVISRMRHTYILVIKFSSIAIYPKIIEIVLISAFAFVYALTRIFHVHFYPIYGQKVIMSLALLYFYYRIVSIYLPISPTLGPLLHRFRLMITVDFVNYMRITLVILISNAIVISALQYPYQSMTVNSVSSVIHKALLSLLNPSPPDDITVKTDLENKEEYCPVASETSIFSDPRTNSTNSHHILKEHSWILYFFVYQYFIVLKLIVGPLLLSLFAATASKWVAEIDNIWKFQRYHLVIEFAHRLSIPEPFSLFYYLYIAGRYLYQVIARLCKLNVQPFNRKRVDSIGEQNFISPDDCIYWKQLAAEYLDTERKKGEESQILFKEWEYIQEISEEITYEKKILREIKAKLAELEKSLRWKAASAAEGKAVVRDMPLSRLSPYPGTNIDRYPLAHKYTSWDVCHFAYEPVCYTKPADEFEDNSFVDEDILKLKEHSLRDKHFTTRITSFKWNDKELDRNGILIDRRSWHIREADDSEHANALACLESQSMASTTTATTTAAAATVKYKLEDNLLPLNPCGRTGIRGKGVNRRWGPNHHFILAIAHTTTNLHDGSKQTMLLLEIMAPNKFQLIERYVNNESEIYEHFAKLFHLEGAAIRNLTELRQSLQMRLGSALADLKLVQRGYFDDCHNTDHAWKEANLYLMQVHHCLARLPSDECRCTWCPLSQHTIAGLSLMHAHVIELVSQLV